MGRLRRSLLVLGMLVPAAGAFAMVSRVPSSAYVVPHVRIATAGEPIRISPADLGAQRGRQGFRLDEAKLETMLDRLTEQFSIPPVPGSYALTEHGVVLEPGTGGVQLDRDQTRTLLVQAFRGRASNLELPVHEVPAPPPPEKAIVVNLSDFLLHLYEGTEMVQHYVVGVGALRFPTPPGVYHVKSKAKNPTWRNPGSAWARSMPAYIPAGPRNPLGTRALRLDRGAIVIHGTPNPSSVGRRSSHGCIRLRKADVEALFEMVPEGTPVFIVP